MAVAVDEVIQMTDNSHLVTAALLVINSLLCRHFKWSENYMITQKKRGSLRNILHWINNWGKKFLKKPQKAAGIQFAFL